MIESTVLQQAEGKVTFGRIDCDREGTGLIFLLTAVYVSSKCHDVK